ncbi:hypothetical protein BMS3Abin17_01223 [archaeon BMS3Abin17]|nr:hypothetical protein BMS3Abin17_01223 [archaeon BMS3Abin17]
MGSLVYGWMVSYIPKDLLDCPEGSAIFIKNVACDKDTLELTLAIENTGRFNLAGYFIHATDNMTQELATLDLSQKIVSGGVLLGSSVIFASENENSIKPGDTTTQTKFSLDKEIYSIELIPIRFQEQEGKMRLASCGDAKVKQAITCSIFSPLGISGLVSWWDFEGDADDKLGRNNGTLMGNSDCSVQGYNGSACYFDGDGDYIDLNDPFPELENFTIIAWVNISGNNTGADTRGIFTSGAGGSNKGYTAGIDNKSAVWMMISDTANDTLNTSEGIITQGIGYNIAVVGVSESYMKIYVDGVERASKSTSQNINSSSPSPRIGTINNPSTGLMNGTIDELMIFNRSLSTAEINTIINYFS